MSSGNFIDIQRIGRVDYLSTFEAMKHFTAARSSKTAQNEHKTDLQPNESGRNQLWICEHPAVYTQGLAGKVAHVLNPGNIPVVQTDRGGQVTFHGPGQVVAYPLIDLKAAGYYVKEYVYRVEESVIKTLAHFGVTGHRVSGAPGIYVRLDDPFSHAVLDTQRPSPQPSPASGRGGNTLTSLPLPLGEGRGEGSSLPNFNNLGKIAALGIKVSHHCTYHGVALNVAMDLEPFSRINPCGYAGLATTDLRSLGVQATWDEASTTLAQKLTSYLAP